MNDFASTPELILLPAVDVADGTAAADERVKKQKALQRVIVRPEVGALIGAILVGLARAAAVHLVPQLELFVIYAVMALVLSFRPYGLFSQAQPRKI